MTITIILHEPQLPENIGTTARAMLNFNLTRLRLVRPRGDSKDAKAFATAAGADIILHDAVVYADLPSALADQQLVFATGAAARRVVKPVQTPRAAALQINQAHAAGHNVAIVFGGERNGLDNDALALAHQLITIPANPDFSSLNLAQAVLVLAYEIATSDKPPASWLPLNGGEPATMAEFQAFIDRLTGVLENGGFFQAPDLKPTMLRNIKAMFMRLAPLQHELRTLHGMITALLTLRPK